MDNRKEITCHRKDLGDILELTYVDELGKQIGDVRIYKKSIRILRELRSYINGGTDLYSELLQRMQDNLLVDKICETYNDK